MRRLAPAATLAVSLLVAPVAGSAQPGGRTYRIALLCPATCSGPSVEAFLQGLRDHGWVASRGVRIEAREAKGQPTRLPALAMELVRLEPDVIVTWTTPGVQAAMTATSTIPVVVANASGLESQGFISSLARPGAT